MALPPLPVVVPDGTFCAWTWVEPVHRLVGTNPNLWTTYRCVTTTSRVEPMPRRPKEQAPSARFAFRQVASARRDVRGWRLVTDRDSTLTACRDGGGGVLPGRGETRAQRRAGAVARRPWPRRDPSWATVPWGVAWSGRAGWRVAASRVTVPGVGGQRRGRISFWPTSTVLPSRWLMRRISSIVARRSTPGACRDAMFHSVSPGWTTIEGRGPAGSGPFAAARVPAATPITVRTAARMSTSCATILPRRVSRTGAYRSGRRTGQVAGRRFGAPCTTVAAGRDPRGHATPAGTSSVRRRPVGPGAAPYLAERGGASDGATGASGTAYRTRSGRRYTRSPDRTTRSGRCAGLPRPSRCTRRTEPLLSTTLMNTSCDPQTTRIER